MTARESCLKPCPPPRVKICGITNEGDAKKGVDLGASMLGIVFARSSPRYLPPNEAQKLVAQCPPSFCFVGVFVDEEAERVREIASFVGLKKLQFQGAESPNFCHAFALPVIKAFRMDRNFASNAKSNSSKNNSSWHSPQNYDQVAAHLFDSKTQKTQGGSGETFDWRLLNSLERSKPWILAGGLNAENIEQAITTVRPDALDLSSALAIDGKPRQKDSVKMEKFFRAIDKACSQ